MLLRVRRQLCILAMLHFMAAAVAGCSTSIGDAPSPGDADDGPGEGDGDEGDGGDGIPGDICAGDPCDIYEQCGCGPGEACDLDGAALATGGTVCRAVATPGQTQSNCDADDQCAAGYSCLGNPGQCRKMCDEDRDCGDGHCIVDVVFRNDQDEFVDVPDARACSKPCKADSLTESGCPTDPAMGCRVYSNDPDGVEASGDEYDYTDCTSAGTGGDAVLCTENGDAECKPGFGCYSIRYTDDTVQDECRQICVVSVGGVPRTTGCAIGTCNGFATPSVIGNIEFGVCL